MTSCPARAKIVPSFPPINPEPRMPTRIPLYLSVRYLLLLSGPLTSAVLRGNEHHAPRSLRLRLPAAGDLRAQVRRQRLRCSLRVDAASSYPGSERSMAFVQAARQVRSEQASPFSVARTCQSD